MSTAGTTGIDREPLEHIVLGPVDKYLASLDRRDFAGVEACFTTGCVAIYNATDDKFATTVSGASRIAAYVALIKHFRSTVHVRGSTRVDASSTTAWVDTFVIAYLSVGTFDAGSVRVRGLRYRDTVVRQGGEWRIAKREHSSMWQYECAAVPRSLEVEDQRCQQNAYFRRES